MQSWPIHEAKARLSELVKRAQQQPQQLTSHGVPVAVVLSSEQEHNLVLISRNLKDVTDLPVAVANPWDPRSSPRPAGESGICTGMSYATALHRKA
jgi:prevent-host-death family protein